MDEFRLFVPPFEIYFDIKHPGMHHYPAELL